ncbi:hypothetical protein GX830_01860 [Candidatus Dojkabacteria bacterium]|nr:hypothetical protein [Candidatus Dojkabacteria bacterium]
MEKKNILPLSIFLLIIVVGSGLAYSIYKGMNSNTQEDKDEEQPSVVIDEDWLSLEYEYVGDNLWRYAVVGALPNPCYSISTSAVVRESYPEQVVVTSIIYRTDKDEICIDSIQEIHEEGEFQASEEAEVSFRIE